MDVFDFRDRLIDNYSTYIGSFIQIREPRIDRFVRERLDGGVLWPEPLIQLNPAFAAGAWIEELIREEVLHPECGRVFRAKPDAGSTGDPMRLHQHQEEAIRLARQGLHYVLTTGTGSGKSLAYIVPIVDHVLRAGRGKGITAIVVYPMNALANSQAGELEKFLCHGYPVGGEPVRFATYTGQEDDAQKAEIVKNPPDILLTNYVMLELILTRPQEHGLVAAAQGLRFLVLDELHTYRGRQGADVALLVRRVQDALHADRLQFVGTSATLAGSGSYLEQRRQVAASASRLFGAQLGPEQVIGETLRRATVQRDLSEPRYAHDLARRIGDNTYPSPGDAHAYIDDPLSGWIESTFGVEAEAGSGRLIRATPRSIGGAHGAAQALHEATGVSQERCAVAVREGLLASYRCVRDPEREKPPFAFRLHQFISRGDTVYASLESEEQRHLTMEGQQFVPGHRDRVLLPLVFCRECGQEYYCVRRTGAPGGGGTRFAGRELSDGEQGEDTKAGFIYYNGINPWPREEEEMVPRLPEDWLEEHRGSLRVRRDLRERLPKPIRVGTGGQEQVGGLPCHYLQAPFRFCLHCGVAYGARQRSDFGKLASLSSEGRSTATTITSLFAVRNLRQQADLKDTARKLLSFTDNRQDAALQAGHFNDFVEIGQLRAALYRAVTAAGAEGLRHDELSQRMAAALDLPVELYTGRPKGEVRFQALRDAQEALREVLGYRLYRDLRRGWRVTAPNLEQCGLLEIRYPVLDEVCEAEDLWAATHPTLAGAAPTVRSKVARVLLDYMRRELAIHVDYLEELKLERIRQNSGQHLVAPWAIDENESLETGTVLFPNASRGDVDHPGAVYLSPRGGFGQYLRRRSTFGDDQAAGTGERLTLEDSAAIIEGLLGALHLGGVLKEAIAPNKKDQVAGYQLQASAMRWAAGDGRRPYHDPIRVPHESEEGGRTNPFFVEFYRGIAAETLGIEAREHTAQVPYDDRLKREQQFRAGTLPVLYCSPTMELGVDISDLNVVNLRNVPPTPANYAQRSGRAGRSGQPALVFSYCSTGNSHDQYFFKRPWLMVSGQVIPPRIDLSNEDLVRAHVQAIWLAESGLNLGKSLTGLLDVALVPGGALPSLALLDTVRAVLADSGARARALPRARAILASMEGELSRADWYHAGWVDGVLETVAAQFDRACDRWRDLYRAALKQAKAQDHIIRDASRSLDDKRQAEGLRREAEAQLKLLTETENVLQSDFYSYRYFASEGFLPGYSFPRLPLSAFIPARRGAQARDEFLSRPRFLAIREFGPRAIVYHEGSRYEINKVILPIRDESLLSFKAKQCGTCGYMHPLTDGAGPDLCQRCHAPLGEPLSPLLRMENVATRRRDKINSDEEERFRIGYELRTGIRFEHLEGRLAPQSATVTLEGASLATLTYGHAATIWRINLGWARRKKQSQHGFVLDVERGYWAKKDEEAGDGDDPMSKRTARVIPYVEDRRNCLLLLPTVTLAHGEMASLQAALKSAIQVEYQLEDNELAVEPLPDRDQRRQILIYESAEGGAGVLRRLLEEPDALARVARRALELCHFDPDTAADLGMAVGAQERCEAACYNCLMTYGNQGDHRLLDRQTIAPLLLELAGSVVVPEAPPMVSVIDNGPDSGGGGEGPAGELLRYLQARGHRLPSHAGGEAQVDGTSPDFLYRQDGNKAAIYVDGSPDTYPDRAMRDLEHAEDLEDRGYSVLRFGDPAGWDGLLGRYPSLFGPGDPHGDIASRDLGGDLRPSTAVNADLRSPTAVNVDLRPPTAVNADLRPSTAVNVDLRLRSHASDGPTAVGGAGTGAIAGGDALASDSTAAPQHGTAVPPGATIRPQSQVPAQSQAAGQTRDAVDLDLFDPAWHPLVRALAALPDAAMEAGDDVSNNRRVVGTYSGEVTAHGRTVYLIDGADPDAAAVRTVLEAQGRQVLQVRTTDVAGAVRDVAEALGR